MGTDPKTRGEMIETASVAFSQRLETASQEYRMQLQQKAAMMRATVLEGETADERVLAVAEALERLAENQS